MCVCVYVHVCVCVRVHACVCVFMYMHVCVSRGSITRGRESLAFLSREEANIFLLSVCLPKSFLPVSQDRQLFLL